MKARLILVCAAAGIAALTFSGSVAGADQFSGSIGFNPDVVEPGYEIDINATCSDPSLTTAPVISQIVEPVILKASEGIPDHDGSRVLSGRTRVKADATPGTWPVSFKCGTETVTGYLRVVAEETPTSRPAISVVPTKGVAGSKVSVNVICVDLQPVTSAALTIGEVAALPGGGEGRPYFAVTGKVKNVKPGTYRVSTKCGAELISTAFTVLADKPAPAKAQVPVQPKKAPETGGGDA
jgi:hypothetical protein